MAALFALFALPPAAGADPAPKGWALTGASSIPNNYWQGLASDSAQETVFFIGVFKGLWRTDPDLAENGSNSSVIPKAVTTSVGYDHVGDPTWNPGDGGRVLLPMECYTPGVGNTCGKGAFGVADPDTLAFRYYVQLDPAEIPKAMWAETSPDGKLVWTSSGDDLLAYRTSDITEANAAPSGEAIKAARELPGAVPPSGVTGAVFRGDHKLLLAGSDGDLDQIWSVDTDTGARRLVVQRQICGEAEGLDLIPTLGGKLHWLISPSDPGCELSFGPTSALLHFERTRGKRLISVRVTNVQVDSVPGEITVDVKATRHNGQPLRDGRISFGPATGRTGNDGMAQLTGRLERPGRFKALARKHGRWGASPMQAVDQTPAAASRHLPAG